MAEDTSNSSSVTITMSDKYNPSRGYFQCTVDNPKFPEILRKFGSGDATMRETATSLIDVLFERDFNGDGAHWCSEGSTVNLIKTHDSGAESYDCKSISEWYYYIIAVLYFR